ncbi:hypothetical protein J5N97_022380 [Dioscorea zingiberensis]|uniref:UspA domain-containing protein n=1 Tax=Dioscorea zingiberensis TaxID=325984 RepID=A0A9D5CB34_9LILI|nr:hypothetical protein J5N97_022380 [Dioscorea zingiberensis]
MESSGGARSFLRQLSSGGRQGREHSSPYHPLSNGGGGSRRWGRGKRGGVDDALKKMGEDGGVVVVGGGGGGVGNKKRVMVFIEDASKKAKHAMMWALTHVANKGDMLILLHVVPSYNSNGGQMSDDALQLAKSLGSHCKSCKPEVDVEAVVIQGPKLATVLSQVKKLEVSVLVLSQNKPSSPFCCLFKNSNEEFVEQCINQAECLTMAVRKQSKGMGGYLVSTRWHKNFWLLA